MRLGVECEKRGGDSTKETATLTDEQSSHGCLLWYDAVLWSRTFHPTIMDVIRNRVGGNWPVCLNYNRSTLRDSVFVFLDVFTFKYSLYYMTINTSIGFVSKMHNDLPSFPDPPWHIKARPLGTIKTGLPHRLSLMVKMKVLLPLPFSLTIVKDSMANLTFFHKHHSNWKDTSLFDFRAVTILNATYYNYYIIWNITDIFYIIKHIVYYKSYTIKNEVAWL